MDIDRSVWISIGLGNVLKQINLQVFDAVRNGDRPVEIKIGDDVVFTSERQNGRIVITNNGTEVSYLTA